MPQLLGCGDNGYLTLEMEFNYLNKIRLIV